MCARDIDFASVSAIFLLGFEMFDSVVFVCFLSDQI
jgi:hypothetical protein